MINSLILWSLGTVSILENTFIARVFPAQWSVPLSLLAARLFNLCDRPLPPSLTVRLIPTTPLPADIYLLLLFSIFWKKKNNMWNGSRQAKASKAAGQANACTAKKRRSGALHDVVPLHAGGSLLLCSSFILVA